MHREKSVMFRFELVSEVLLDSTYKDMRTAILKADPVVSKFYSVRKSNFGNRSIIVRVTLNPEINNLEYEFRHLVPSVGLVGGKYVLTLVDYTEIEKEDREIEQKDELFAYNIPESAVKGFICNMDFANYYS